MSIRNSYSAFTSKIVIIEKHKNTVEKLTSLPYDLQSKKYAKIGGTPRARGPARGGGGGGVGVQENSRFFSCQKH